MRNCIGWSKHVNYEHSMKFDEEDGDDVIIDSVSLNYELVGFKYDLENKIEVQNNDCFTLCLTLMRVHNKALNSFHLNLLLTVFLSVRNFR